MEEPSFTSDGDALDYYRSLARSLQSDLDDTKLALDEFQVSSKELETELERELQATEKQLKELRGKEEHLLHEIDQWKIKYHSSLKDHTKTMTHMQTELETCRKSNEEYRTRLRDMELDNDELEGKERMVASSLQDVESKYGKAIERITLLEDELIEKSKLEEEHQRLKDDLRDMTEELAVLREHLASSATSPAGEATRRVLSPSPEDCQLSTRTFSETPLSDPGLEVLKDTDEMSSPSRPMIRTKPTSVIDAQDSHRRRLSSMAGEIGSPKSQTAKSLAITQSKKAASLRVKPHSVTIKPLQNVFSPDPRLAASTSAAPRAKRSQSRSRPALETPTNPRNLNKESSHLQSLRAETERMQGMTKKLVSSRNLRTVSAIPVPKTSLLSSSIHSKSNPHSISALSRSSTTRSPRRPPNGVSLTASRTVTQPATSQDRDLDTGLPRPKSTRPLSRLSISSDQQQQQHQHQLGISMMGPSDAPPSCAIPRRKASIDMTERFPRPLSIQDVHKSHLRRQSTGFTGPPPKLDPNDRKPKFSSNPLGKSFSTSIRAAGLSFKR
ncbi:NADH:ubiquinone oxidoreductase [Puccinia graminis f. sp. tritici]|uniref:NADH:ubiquinone oxidoreductase n=1 Tax=Puccinia graminis f. sp. tritici TaxID=56615 RepID=A0A5B0MBZ3_PUCGR|nr:NADH:ubiquinone oxidoreductase [Puccinia graminis f. sp. tritici]KAA1090646.1 NADH:ubiquinone oxidoreductase [Puccinia graminis f. sp. tritici]